MLLLMGGVCLAALSVLGFVMRHDFAWAGGFAAGAAAQIFKFAFIDLNTIRKIAVQRENAPATQLKASFLSLAIFAAALAAVYKFDLNIWACAAGILLPRIVLIVDTYVRPNPFASDASADGEGLEEVGDA